VHLRKGADYIRVSGNRRPGGNGPPRLPVSLAAPSNPGLPTRLPPHRYLRESHNLLQHRLDKATPVPTGGTGPRRAKRGSSSQRRPTRFPETIGARAAPTSARVSGRVQQ
jgi:hypothetical protein